MLRRLRDGGVPTCRFLGLRAGLREDPAETEDLMNRTTTRLIAATALCVATLATAPRAAHAYDLNGIGLGADVLLVAPIDLGAIGGGATAFSGPSGLALSIGLGSIVLDFIVGVSLSLPEGGVLEPDLLAAAGLFAVLAGSDTTNLEIGGRLGVIVDGNSGTGFGAELETNAGMHVELDARVTHRLDDHCVLNFTVGVMTQIWPDDPDAGTGTDDFVMAFGASGLVGGAGFRYYFDSLGSTPAPTPEPVAAPPPRAEPAPAPAPAAEPAAETPYWEQ